MHLILIFVGFVLVQQSHSCPILPEEKLIDPENVVNVMKEFIPVMMDLTPSELAPEKRMRALDMMNNAIKGKLNYDELISCLDYVSQVSDDIKFADYSIGSETHEESFVQCHGGDC